MFIKKKKEEKMLYLYMFQVASICDSRRAKTKKKKVKKRKNISIFFFLYINFIQKCFIFYQKQIQIVFSNLLISHKMKIFFYQNYKNKLLHSVQTTNFVSFCILLFAQQAPKVLQSQHHRHHRPLLHNLECRHQPVVV